MLQRFEVLLRVTHYVPVGSRVHPAADCHRTHLKGLCNMAVVSRPHGFTETPLQPRHSHTTIGIHFSSSPIGSLPRCIAQPSTLHVDLVHGYTGCKDVGRSDEHHEALRVHGKEESGNNSKRPTEDRRGCGQKSGSKHRQNEGRCLGGCDGYSE